MAESMSDPITHCPWCSVLLPEPGVELCPACGAALTAVPNSPAEIKGVTTLDTEAILRARSEVSKPRYNRLMSFITGEVPVDTSTPAAAEVFAPPPEDVRREMMRLQMDAQRADLVAETVALKADELARLGIHVSELGGEEPVVDDVAVPEAPEGVAEDALEAADSAATAAEAGPSAAEPDAKPYAEPAAGWPAELMPGEPESAASDLEPAEPEPAEPEPEADSRG
jgi:hypothetical protein